jgi:hypothetical protein
MQKLISICINLEVHTHRNLAISTNRNLGALNPLFQAELQCLVTPQFPKSSCRIPPPTRRFHLMRQGRFLKSDTDSNHLCTLAHGAFGTPRRLLHNQFDRFKPPLLGFVVAVAHADELIAGLVKQFFVPFWPGCRAAWTRTV